jgi:hypothetical protein
VRRRVGTDAYAAAGAASLLFAILIPIVNHNVVF